MEIADVRRRVVETIERARGHAAARRARAAAASTSYEAFLEQAAVPIAKQVANVLRANGYLFDVSTPAGSVRLESERAAGDFIQIELDTTGDRPVVVGRARHSRGRQVVESEQLIGDPSQLGEAEALAFILKELEPFVER
jgi:hypothetical protein